MSHDSRSSGEDVFEFELGDDLILPEEPDTEYSVGFRCYDVDADEYFYKLVYYAGKEQGSVFKEHNIDFVHDRFAPKEEFEYLRCPHCEKRTSIENIEDDAIGHCDTEDCRIREFETSTVEVIDDD